MKNFTQLLPGRDGSNAKTNNTSGHAHAFTLLLTLLLTFGVGQMWGATEGSNWYDASNAKVYFDNTNSSYNNVSILIGRQWNYGDDGVGSSGTNLTKISGTNNLYYASVSFTKYTTFCFIDATNWGWEGNIVTARCGHAAHYTNTPNDDLGSSTHLYVPASGNNDASVTHTTPASYSALNSTQTINTVVKTGSGSYTAANSKATISITSYEMTGDGTATKRTPSLETSANTQTVSAARTATTTYTVGDVATGYQFDGWYTEATGGTQLSSSKTYTYYPTAATTVYARFSEKMSTVTLIASPAGVGSFTIGSAAATSTTAGVTTKRSVTAVPISGYHFVRWSITGGAHISSTTANPTTVTGDGTGDDATLTATFEADAVNSLTVSAGTHVTTVTGSTRPVTLGNKYAINATAFETGWQFLNWTATPAENGTFDNASSASTNVTVKNASVTVTANAQEIMRTITISGGTVYGGVATSTTAGVATAAKVTANAPAEGKKFTGWTLGTGVSLAGGYSLTDHTIEIYSTANATVTANYADRASVKLYFPKPSGWTKVYAYAWKDGGTNNTWPGAEMTSYETVGCVDYYYYLYYTEEDGTGGDATGNSTWDKVIFNNGSSNKTADLALSNGHYYYIADAFASSGRTTALESAWLVKGDFNSWGETDALTPNCGANTATKTISLTAGAKTFKIYNAVNGQWWRVTGNISATIAATTMNNSNDNMTLTPTVAGDYIFTISNTNTAAPSLAITYPTAYTLTYSIGSVAGTDGSISTSPSTSSGSYVVAGTNVTLTAPAAKTGYTWKGWYTDAAGTTGKIADTNRAITVTMDADKTLYACYTINNHAITHSDASNGSYTIKVGNANAVSTNTTSDFGKTITLAATPETGYHFDSWTAYKTGTPGTTVTVTNNQFTMPDYAVTVGATFLINNYTIAFNANDDYYVGTATGTTASIAATYGVSYTLTSNGFSRAGYTFAGWNSKPDGSGTAYTNEQTGVTNLTAENGAIVTLYAQYTPNDYTVTFNANGGTCGTASKSVTFNAAYGDLPEATKDAKGFVGWYTTPSGDGTQVTAETTVSTANNHTLYARFEDTYSVTIQYKSGDVTLKPNGSTTASAHVLSPEITAPEFLGYTFTGWTGSNVAAFANASSATTTVNVTAATTITANYSAIPTVYFKNNLGWEHVYVTFDAYYGTAGGATVPGQNGKPYYEMTQMGESDIFYCVIPDAIVSSWKSNIAFDNKGYASTDNVGKYGLFYQGEFIGRSDFASEATMFIPYNGDKEGRNGGTYYRTGCWMKYNSTDPGYKVYANTYKEGSGGSAVAGTPVLLTADIAGGYEFKATVNFPTPDYAYGFMLKKEATSNTNDLWYTNTSDIYASTTTLPWDFTAAGASENGKRCGLHTEATGNYVITVSFATGKPMVDVTYPVSTGDWKLIYKDRATWSNGAHTADWQHPSRVIKAKAGAEDIVSFYVANDSTPSVELHKCTKVNALTGAQTWVKQSDVDLREITKTGIYNFKVSQDAEKAATVTVDGAYAGNFYIRTDVSDGGWSNYKTSGTNTMTYSEYAEENSGFTHYFMHYVHTGTNIKFCIANDYSECISDTLVGDSFTGEYMAVYGNVRFMWDHRTNKVSRAYISGSTNVYDRFLVLQGDAKMFNKAGTALTGNGHVNGLNENEMNFTDDQNWIYEATVQAQPGARFKLTAKYNNKVQYFYGDEDVTEQLLGGNGESTTKYTIRIVYDFKTNRLIKAFIPSGTISDNLSIEADLMIIREHQEDAQQINFTGSGALSNVKTVYGAMKFNKWTVNGKEKTGGHASTGDSRYKRDLFYISFPFDVELSEVFGFGTYGTHWIIEYYDGKGRAKNGFWADSDSYWKFVLPSQRNSFTLKAFEGYILALDLDEMTESSSIWNHGVEDVYVYFPSSAAVENIQAINRLIPIDQEGYQCQIGSRFDGGDDRRVKDSYWHVIGVPSFANYNSTLTDANGDTDIDWSDDNGEIDWETPSLPYLYEWNSADNSLTVTTSATFNFKATYSYMVQYAGASIYWSAINATPQSVVARKNDNQPTSAEFRLELQQTGKAIDQTFVRLTDEVNVTTGFDFNYDLSKEMNANKANIFTMITTAMDDGNTVTESAANCLPMSEQTTVVPVGVKIAANNDYTFSIPDGANGVGVTLIDNLTGTRTNLSAVDYTVSLEAGTYNERFTLEISPIQYLPTELEQSDINNQMSDVRKVLIDGLLYIVHDNKMYDARGARVE